MKNKLTLLIASLLLGSSSAYANDNNISTRVVGGDDSAEGDWPWMVFVSAGDYRCGGSLIDERTVLTAAHCLHNGNTAISADEISVIVGAYDLHSPETYISISRTYIHSEYDPTNNASSSDLALLRLSKKLTGADTVKITTPSTTSNAVSAQSDVTILGWGSTVGYAPDEAVTPSYPNILQEAQLPLQTDTDCQENAGESYNSSTMLCAGDKDGGKDACQGDSGGPLALNNGGNWEQIGVVSWGAGCASAGNPGVYVRVATYQDWIDNFLTGIAIHNKLSFGKNNVGESQQLNLLISNNSTASAELSFSLTGTDEFIFDSSICATIAADSICLLPITYNPNALLESTATLTIESNIAGTNNVSTVLSGNLSYQLSASGGGSLFFIFTLPLFYLRRYRSGSVSYS